MNAGRPSTRRILPTVGAISLAASTLVGSGGACGGVLDAGHDKPHGDLPVDERNPVIIDNDNWADNWMGEYAVLLGASGGPPLAGVITSSTRYWPDINANSTGWTNLLKAARESGLKNLPKVTTSFGGTLDRPADGVIENTVANNSVGGKLIVDLSQQLSTPSRPLVVLTGAQLTTVADAYLIDNTVTERVVVVSSLGSYDEPNGIMSGPNGELDPWADWIVAQRFRYVQVSAYYDQTKDVADTEVANLPKNPLGAWMAKKQPDLLQIPSASDQVAVLAVGLTDFVRTGNFVRTVQRASPDLSDGFDSKGGPPLKPDLDGNVWVVSQIAGPLAKSRLWQLLLRPQTFAP
jgi:hypothetical protein